MLLLSHLGSKLSPTGFENNVLIKRATLYVDKNHRKSVYKTNATKINSVE